MKTLLLFFTILVLGVEAFAQQLNLVVPNYYRKDTIYVMNGYRYRCEGTKGVVVLYNADYQNQWENKVQVYKETGEYFDSEFGKNNPIVDDFSMDQKVLNIIDNAFSKEFVEYLKDHECLTVTMFLDSETGRVEEVSFWFIPNSAYASLPISTYRKIELQLINKVSYIPSEIGKQLNYIMLSLRRKPLGADSSGAELKPSE